MSAPTSDGLVIAWDLYGTLLSTASIAKQLAEHVGDDKATSIAAEWRKYQLEYTWRLNSMGQYEPFSTVTARALSHALQEAGASLSTAASTSLMTAYDTLNVFPDVPQGLEAVQAASSSINSVIFSNGTLAMVSASMQRSPDLTPFASLFTDLIVVEEVRKFKPTPETYQYLARRVGKEGKMEQIWLVSANPFDIVGANACGLKTAWVDREGKGWADAVIAGEKGRPTVIAKTLGELVDSIIAYGK